MFGLSPQQRADRAAERIGALPRASLGGPVEVATFSHEGVPGYFSRAARVVFQYVMAATSVPGPISICIDMVP